MKRLLVGVSGGIAAYKAVEFVRLAMTAGYSVRVVQTPASLRFVGRSTFSALTGAPVLVSEFESDPLNGSWPGDEVPDHRPISHLALVDNADCFVVAPATANLLSRLAGGGSEDLVSAAVLASRIPVVIAPAMNGSMWDDSATKANVDLLRDRGYTVLEPGVGNLAAPGEHGKGRLIEPDRLLEVVEQITSPVTQDLDGVSVLVTAGGTREAIDPVRFIGNRSSGRMGVELARAASQRGAKVTLILANPSVEPPVGVETVTVMSTAEMEDACERHFAECDVLVMAAAVADFVPAHPSPEKIKKSAGFERLELVPAPDVLAGLGQRRRADQVLVGFAAEHGGDARSYAKAKLTGKNIDLIVLNDVSIEGIGFESEDNAVTLITTDSEEEVGKNSKAAVSMRIIDAVVRLRDSRLPVGRESSPAPASQ